MTSYRKSPDICQGLWDKMSLEDKMKYGEKVEDNMSLDPVCRGEDFGGVVCPFRDSCSNYSRYKSGKPNLSSCRDGSGKRICFKEIKWKDNDMKSKDNMIRKIDKHKAEISLSDLQYWIFQLKTNPLNKANIIGYMENIYNKSMKNFEVENAVKTLLNIDPECLDWLKHTQKEDILKLIEKLEVSLNS